MNNIIDNQNPNAIDVCFKEAKLENVIKFSSAIELNIYLYFLGSLLNLRNERLPEEIKNWLNEKSFEDVAPDIKIPLQKNKTILSCLEKIRINNDFRNRRIIEVDKNLVHKSKSGDVMIKLVEKADDSSNLITFLGNPMATTEIQLDHKQNDHVEAIFLSEVCRQASTATAEMYLGGNQQFLISEEYKKYYRLVEREKEVIVQAAIIGKGGPLGLCVFTLAQGENLCMSGYLMGYIREENKSEKN